MPAIVTIDGVSRHTVNSLGRPIASSTEGVASFWSWFGDSVATDAQGRPMVFFHGAKTPDGIVELEPGGREHSRLTGDAYGVAVYFTSCPLEASFHARDEGAVFPVYIRGRHLDLNAPLHSPDQEALTQFANGIMLPSDKARFASGRVRRSFDDVCEARDFFDAQRANWVQFGERMDRARPEAIVEGSKFIVEYTDFDAQVQIATGDHAHTLFRAIGFDNIPAAGFDGLLMNRDGGARWAVIHRPSGNVMPAIGLHEAKLRRHPRPSAT